LNSGKVYCDSIYSTIAWPSRSIIFFFFTIMSFFAHKNTELLFAKACEKHSQLDFTSAEQIYLELLELLPESSMVHYNAGLLYYETEDYERALLHFAAARSYAPRDPDVLFNLALCQKKTGRFREAILSFTEFSTKFQEDPDGFYNLGNCHRELKEFEETIAAYLQVLKLNRDHMPAMKNLAYVYHLQGDCANSITLYRDILTLEPDNSQVRHMLASLTGVHSDQAPHEYIEGVFDSYSDTFETNLLEDLHYSVPADLRAGADIFIQYGKAFNKGIDLGCGTGLAGLEFHELCDHLTGVDISSKMVEKAKSKNIYNILEVAEVTFFLKTKRNLYDLIIAADLLTYLGDLEPIFKAVTAATTDKSFFCFSTENGGRADYQLLTTGRFAHLRKYVVETARKYGWSCLDISDSRLRKEKNDWVQGTLYFMEKL